MANAGAIATTSLVPATTIEAKWKSSHEGLSRFAGRELTLNEEVYACASQTNYRNQSIARLLQSFGRIYFDPEQATDLYTRQCSLNVSAKDLAVMGATLADGGLNPLSRERVNDDRGIIRDLRRLALRHRVAGQERDQRRDRHRLSEEGRARDFRPAVGRRRKQREGAARRGIRKIASAHGRTR